jgi:membrane protein implicated in regulation of membrane protease activity
VAVWVVWLVLAAALGAAELLLTLSAALGLLGGAAAVASGAAALGAPVALQLLVFAAGAAAGVWLVRPVVLCHLHAPPAQRFGVDALVGRTAHVVRDVSGQGGLVRIDGERWSARPCDPHDRADVISAGSLVSVTAIRGATALVYPQE